MFLGTWGKLLELIFGGYLKNFLRFSKKCLQIWAIFVPLPSQKMFYQQPICTDQELSECSISFWPKRLNYGGRNIKNASKWNYLWVKLHVTTPEGCMGKLHMAIKKIDLFLKPMLINSDSYWSQWLILTKIRCFDSLFLAHVKLTFPKLV